MCRMIEADDLFLAGDAAEGAGDFDLALRCFQQGAALSDKICPQRLGYMYGLGIGVEVDKSFVGQ